MPINTIMRFVKIPYEPYGLYSVAYEGNMNEFEFFREMSEMLD